MSEDKEELNIVTEVGTFGDLDIVDPTKKKVQRKGDIEELIAESTTQNLQNLTK